MEIKQLFITSLKSLFVNKVRCVQVMLSMVIGVASLVTLLNIRQPMLDVVEWVFNQYDSPDTINFAVMTNVNNTKRVTVDNMRQLALDNPDIIEAISPHILSTLPLVLKNNTDDSLVNYYVYGVDENYLNTVNNLHMAEGRFFHNMEIDREQKVCVVGANVNINFNNDILGRTLRIWGDDYEVIGVLYASAADYNFCVMIPYTNLKRLQGETITPMQTQDGYGGEFYVDDYYMKANGEENISNARLVAVAMLEELLGTMNRDWYYHSASFRYFKGNEISWVYEVIGSFMILVVLVIIVGAVGITNIMLAAVQERTKEIGIRKAFGAANKDIKRQFLTEAVIISLLGGLLGCGLGVVGTYIGCWLTYTPVSFLRFSIMPFAIALLVTFGVGVLSGIYPANRAAKMEIVDAINSD